MNIPFVSKTLTENRTNLYIHTYMYILSCKSLMTNYDLRLTNIIFHKSVKKSVYWIKFISLQKEKGNPNIIWRSEDCFKVVCTMHFRKYKKIVKWTHTKKCLLLYDSSKMKVYRLQICCLFYKLTRNFKDVSTEHCILLPVIAKKEDIMAYCVCIVFPPFCHSSFLVLNFSLCRYVLLKGN